MDIEAFLAAHGLPQSYVGTIERVHVPLAAAIHKKCIADRLLVIGICGAQGSGKSTMALVLRSLLQEQGVSCAVMSLDDLYLTRAERESLAKRVHPLFVTRGVPGTHDVELGIATIHALRRTGTVALPIFDKSIDDRLPVDSWPRVDAPINILLFEGWCVGALPQDEAALRVPQNELERVRDPGGTWRKHVNDALRGPYRQLFDELDALILLQAPGFDVVLQWRTEQERKLRAHLAALGTRGRVMSDEELVEFVASYERLTRHLLAEMPSRADALVRLSSERSPLEVIIRGRLA